MYNTDIVIIGAGVVGTAIARELSRYDVRVMVVDKRDDVGGDASISNSGIIGSAWELEADTLEMLMCRAARALIEKIVRDLEVPYKMCGTLMPVFNDKQMAFINEIYNNAYKNYVYCAEIISAEEVLEMEPELNPDVIGSFYIPLDGVIDSMAYAVAMAENSAENGVEFLLGTEVTGIEKHSDAICAVETTKGRIKTSCVINAAGVFADKIAEMIGECDFSMNPRRGQFLIIDRTSSCMVEHIIAPPPSDMGHGIMITPTAHDNVILGPTAEDLIDTEEHAITAEGLIQIEEEIKALVPNMQIKDTIKQYCGLRPNRTPPGYHIELSKTTKGYLGLTGIRSTGIMSCCAVAKYGVKLLLDSGMELPRKKFFHRTRKGIERFSTASNDRRQELIEQDSRYGHVICRCETVTEAEIIQAIHRPVGARTVDGIKRRLRAGMGRCQGGFCGPRVIEILARELNIPVEQINKGLAGSYMTTGRLR